MQRHSLYRYLIAALFAVPACTVQAAGFYDQGFQNPRIRTDFALGNEGTAANPLTVVAQVYPGSSFPWQSNFDPIMIPPGIVWSAPNYIYSPAYEFRSGTPLDPHWVLILNNEYYYKTTDSGPPGLSLPRVEPGTGIMGFSALTQSLQGESFWRAHMVLNHYFDNPNPDGQGAIPFMSIGADDDRQPGGPLGAIRATGSPATAPHVLTWTSRMWSAEPGLWNHYLYAIAEWGGKPRMLLVNLAWSGIYFSSPQTPTLHRHWNWQFGESSLQPGADMVYIDADRLSQVCAGVSMAPIVTPNVDVPYTLDLSKAFQCMSQYFDEPIPASGEFPIHTASWAVEATGSTAVWASVHGMRLTNPASEIRPKRLTDAPADTSRSIESPAMTEIRRQIDQARQAAAGRGALSVPVKYPSAATTLRDAAAAQRQPK